MCSIIQQGTFAGMVDRPTLNIVIAGANNASGIAPAPASRSVDYTGVPVTVPFD